MSDLMQAMHATATRARLAAAQLRTLDRARKDAVLQKVAELLRAHAPKIIAANARDVAAAREAGLGKAAIDRLLLDAKRLDGIAQACMDVAALPDPVGATTSEWTRPNGLHVSRVRIPIGVILMIYESRPNVTVDAAALCLKSGNAVILRGGKESLESNVALGSILREACAACGAPADAIQVVDHADRESIYELLKLDGLIDLVIPRGGESLIRAVAERSRIPVLKHYKGVCHVYVDRSGDADKAVAIVLNAKTQRPGVCNAMETLLVDEPVAQSFVPRIVAALRERGVRIKACERSRTIVADLEPADEADYTREYLDLVMNLRVVDGVVAAAQHIERYGSQHTETIVAEDASRAREFVRLVDSSTICVNASTRFADGGELGLGAEIGISTTKLHAFGPMGLEELTTQKFVVIGNGQVRS